MTVQAFRKNKLSLFIIVSAIFIVLGIGAFVLAYGISDGWQAVANWFTSQYAYLLYIFIGCYALLILILFLFDWSKKI